MKEQKFLLEIGAECNSLIDDILEELLEQPKYSMMVTKPLCLKNTNERVQTFITAFPEIYVNYLEDFYMALIAQQMRHITFDYQQLMFYAWKNIDTAKALVKIETLKYK